MGRQGIYRPMVLASFPLCLCKKQTPFDKTIGFSNDVSPKAPESVKNISSFHYTRILFYTY